MPKYAWSTFGFNVPGPKIAVKRLEGDGDLCIGEVHRVRVYWFHESETWVQTAPGTGVSDTYSGSSLETINETVSLQWGKGSRSYFDLDGVSEIYEALFAFQAFASYQARYDVRYFDFDLYALSAGNHEIMFYLGDIGSPDASVVYSFTVTDCGPTDPNQYQDQATCEAAGFYWYADACHADPPAVTDYQITVRHHYTKEPLQGVAVYLGESETLIGTTDESGSILLEDVTRGETYALKLTKTGYQDSDSDTIWNDEVTIPYE